MMKGERWLPTPVIKIYEALGAIADDRILVEENGAIVTSSSRNKTYKVKYDAFANGIASNDNASYYVGYLGYPAVAFLMKKHLVEYDHRLLRYFKDIAWKDINVMYENNFEKTQVHVDTLIIQTHSVNVDQLHQKLELICSNVNALGLKRMKDERKPPAGY